MRTTEKTVQSVVWEIHDQKLSLFTSFLEKLRGRRYTSISPFAEPNKTTLAKTFVTVVSLSFWSDICLIGTQ